MCKSESSVSATSQGVGFDTTGNRRLMGEAKQTPIFQMGFHSAISWDKALSLAGELEDKELFQRFALAAKAF